ncbi:hypothetical protein TNCV_3812661 [Trichonephila clavipes]|nr:hypothetical protein TNCV_3812661 [Trichonephila clavipes]
MYGSSNLMINATESWLTRHEFEPSTSEVPPCREGQSTLIISRLKRPPVGVVLNSNIARAKKVARFNERFPQAERRKLEQAEREAAHGTAETPEQYFNDPNFKIP